MARHPKVVQNFEDEVISLGQRIKDAKQKRAEADADEEAARARLAELTGVQVRRTNGAAAPQAPSQSGQGDRIVAVLRENPRAKLGWLATQIYGKDSPETRQSLGSMLHYLLKTERVRKAARGEYEAVP
jgi:hypothetical protein